MDFGWWEGMMALIGLGGGTAGGIGASKYAQGKANGRLEAKLDEVQSSVDNMMTEIKKIRKVVYGTQRRVDTIETLLEMQSGATAKDILGRVK